MSCVGLCANDFNCGNARGISFMDLPRAGAEVADEGARLAVSLRIGTRRAVLLQLCAVTGVWLKAL